LTEIPALLGMAFRAATDEVHARMADQGYADIRPSHGYAFQFLSWRPEGVTAVALGVHLGVTKQAAVQLADDLDKRGYIERRADPADRRARLIFLTQRGWDAIACGVAAWKEVEDRWAALIGGPDHLERLRADLTAYVTSVTGDGPPSIRPVW
jgi:DNA-binding MarR family transcriptional regulator